jgi:hypothetical protein
MSPTKDPKDNTAVNANRLAQIEKMEAKVRVKAEAKGFDVAEANLSE